MWLLTNKKLLISLGAAAAFAGLVVLVLMTPEPTYGFRTIHRSVECEEMSANMLGRCTGRAKNISKPHCVRMRADYAKLCR